MALDVVGVGYPVMDCLISLPEIPPRGTGVQFTETSWQGGGMVGTGLVAVSVLGGMEKVKCGMIGSVGDDKEGYYSLMDMKRNGVDISHIKMCPGTFTDFSFILSEVLKSERTFIYRGGRVGPLTMEDLDEDYIAQAKILYLASMKDIDCAAARMARKHGVKVFIDADVFNQDVVDHIDLIDYLVASEEFYNGLFGDKDLENIKENTQKMAAMGPEIALVTLGSRGVAGMFRGEYLRLPAFRGLNIVDTTGAGDVFHGAFVYALVRGWSGEECARFACAVAGIKCTKLGGRAAICQEEVAKKFIETGVIDYTDIDKRVAMYAEGFAALNKE